MLWVINSLIYGFFTAVYTVFNQHYKVNGYVLGVWRGFGICILFLPFLFFFEVPTDLHYWILLILQGLMIGVYDSHLFFASAQYGAGPTSRFMAITVLVTTFAWWALTPYAFSQLLADSSVFITLLLILCGFTFCYWQMIQSEVSKALARYIMPAVFALAGMSIITKYISQEGTSVWQAMVYYLTVATFVSGSYNLVCYWVSAKDKTGQQKLAELWAGQMWRIGGYLVLFSAILISAKTMALRLAPNPGYVTALLLTAPIFVYAFNSYYKIKDDISFRAGFAMVFFLLLLVLLVSGNYGVND